MFIMTDNDKSIRIKEIQRIYEAVAKRRGVAVGTLVPRKYTIEILHNVFPLRRVREWVDLYPEDTLFSVEELCSFLDFYIATRNGVEGEVYYANRI
jgi:hypothetical protein